MTYNFKEHVKIVKVYMVKFNITIFNRLKESSDDYNERNIPVSRLLRSKLEFFVWKS